MEGIFFCQPSKKRGREDNFKKMIAADTAVGIFKGWFLLRLYFVFRWCFISLIIS